MAFGDIIQTKQGNASFTTSVALTFDSDVTAGNSIIAIGHNVNEGSGTDSCTDTQSNVYSEIVDEDGRPGVVMFMSPAVAGGATTVTITIGQTGGTGFVAGCIIEVEGELVLHGSTIELEGTTALQDIGDLTTTEANALLVLASAKDFSGAGQTPGSGWTQRGNPSDAVQATCYINTRFVASTGTYEASLTSGADGQAFGGVAAAFIENGGAPPPDDPNLGRLALLGVGH